MTPPVTTVDPSIVAAQYAFYSIVVQAAVTVLGAIVAGIFAYLLRRLETNGNRRASQNNIRMNAQDDKLNIIHDDINGRVAETIAVQVKEKVREAVREAVIEERAKVAKIKKEE